MKGAGPFHTLTQNRRALPFSYAVKIFLHFSHEFYKTFAIISYIYTRGQFEKK